MHDGVLAHRNVCRFRQHVHWDGTRVGLVKPLDLEHVIDNVAYVKSVQACLEAKVYNEPNPYRLSLTYSVADCLMFDSGATFRFRLRQIRHSFRLKLKQR